MAKFRLKWQRYFRMYDVKGEFCDNAPGMIYGDLPFHQLLNFKKYKKFSSTSLFGPYSFLHSTVNHTLKFKDPLSKYNTDLVFDKLFLAYRDYDKVMKNMVQKRIQYVPVVGFYFAIGFFYRVDCYISLCKNWDEFISDCFLDFYENWHHKYRDDLGASYFTFFDSKMKAIFYKHYILNRDRDSFDLQQEVYRYSWIEEEDNFSFKDISSYSNYTRYFEDPIVNYLNDKEKRSFEKLCLPQVVSPKLLTKY